MAIKLLTWNIEGRGLSAAAPRGFGILQKQEAVVQHISKHAPDVIAFQEVFNMNSWQDLLTKHEYDYLGGTLSHCGITTLFLKRVHTCQTVFTVGPAFCAEVQCSNMDVPVLVAGCHLEPFKEGAEVRQQQLQAILRESGWLPRNGQKPAVRRSSHQQAQSSERSQSKTLRQSTTTTSNSNDTDADTGSDKQHQQSTFVDATGPVSAWSGTARSTAEQPMPVLIVGDMNMRENETAYVTSKAGLGLTDAYLVAASSNTAAPGSKFTWDTKRNKYYPDGFEYTCRYDRVFFLGDQWKGVESFELVGHEPEAGVPGFYLSDHFGIVTNLQLHSCAGSRGGDD